METFNIIAGTASLLSLLISLITLNKVVKVSNQLNSTRNKNIKQEINGKGNDSKQNVNINE